jgi:hypothetical protein
MREHYIIDNTGKRTAVVLSVRDYERIIEDLHDLGVAAKRRDEPTTVLAEVLASLDGRRPSEVLVEHPEFIEGSPKTAVL